MNKENYLWTATKTGLLGGAIGIFLCLIGMVEIFDKRDVIEAILPLGDFLILATAVAVGIVASRQNSNLSGGAQTSSSLTAGAVAGLVTGILLALLALIGPAINLRAVFLNASPALFELLTFGLGTTGAILLALGCGLAGLGGSAFLRLSENTRRPLTQGLGAIVFMALFAGIFRVAMINLGGLLSFIAKSLFSQSGLTIVGAIFFFAVVTGFNVFWTRKGQGYKDRFNALPKKNQSNLRLTALIVLAVVALGLPQISGPFIAQVIVIISLYILMGLGLNITLGFAGLLDLGFVAFYAVGAYTVGLLTSYGPFGLQHIPFWVAVPIAVLVAMMFGAFLGLPVLGVRGDYLAIATMGFGEIIRLFAGSDFLSPFFGGPQGVIGIQKPCIGTLEAFLTVDTPRICNGIELGRPQDIYYLAVVAALLIAFVATRLRESRLGRAWMAIREDEDVAEALGVNLVQTKLLAYMLGAAFAGLGGAIFTVLIGSIFATSMQLIVSINVVALIIVGGMGSIPGVIVGAIALIGLPELLREVSEYRYLIYGVVLIIMMQLRPEGLWPSQAAKRELHHSDNLTVKVE